MHRDEASDAIFNYLAERFGQIATGDMLVLAVGRDRWARQTESWRANSAADNCLGSRPCFDPLPADFARGTDVGRERAAA
jgi:hypothetical protein